VCTNALDQVLIEGPSLEACHGKRLVAVAVLMTCFELGKGHRAQTGIEVKSKSLNLSQFVEAQNMCNR
jgi:hypothetical protein